jgi:TatD DNase family protein
MIDSHAHLTFKQYRSDLEVVLRRAHEAGIGAIINVGIDLASSEAAVRLAGSTVRSANLPSDPGVEVFATVGVHPHDAKTVDAAAIERLEVMADDPRVVAIGEIGLDYYRDLSPRHVQEKAFRDQITLAKKRGLPVVVHDRDAHTKVMQILKEEGVSKGVLHCFTGDFGIAKQAVDLGLYLSFTGAVTYSGSKAAEIIRKMPVDRLLIETDCPYLTPVPFRGKRNEPAYVRYVLEHVAGILGKPAEEIDALTEQNTRKCFGLPQA